MFAADTHQELERSGGLVGQRERAGDLGLRMAFVPAAVVAYESGEGPLVDLGPLPGRGQARKGGGRLGQQAGRVLAAGLRGSQKIAEDDAEVATAATGVGPPQVPVRVVGAAGGDHPAGLAVLVHDHHLDAVEMVDDHAVLARQGAVTAARGMATDADAGAAAAGDGDAPAVVQVLVDLGEGGARLDGERLVLRVEGDVVHRGDVKDDPDIGPGDEVLVAVSSAADGDPLPGAYRLFHRLDDLLARVHGPDGVGPWREPSVVALVEARVPGVVGADGDRARYRVTARPGPPGGRRGGAGETGQGGGAARCRCPPQHVTACQFCHLKIVPSPVR